MMESTPSSKCVVILDDNDEICALVAAWLRSLGHNVQTANRGREFLAGLVRGVPDVVITDILMSPGDGFEVIEAVKSISHRTKVIAISGGGNLLGGSDYLKLARTLGADAVVPKPFTSRQMIDTFNAVVS